MAKIYNWDDDYIEELSNDMFDDRQTRRKRKAKPRHEPKKSTVKVVEELADDNSDLAEGYTATYKPSKHEAEWLLQSLHSFYYQDLISDVNAVVKGGKEANVYRVKAHETVGVEWLAAKVYRPRMFRQLRNDTVYREGRVAVGEDGKDLNAKDWRAVKAMNKGSGYGQALSHTSWLMYEYNTLRALHEAGASVPKPYAVAENALLMEYLGNEDMPARTLSEVRIAKEEVQPLFTEVMRNIDIMLQHGLVHGDLSAYNLMYWEGKIYLIDFPQVVKVKGNRHAREILTRDIVRVCEYFQNLGLKINAERLANRLWRGFGKADENQEELLVNMLEAVSFDDYEPKEYD
jgi:RIO kinase 1